MYEDYSEELASDDVDPWVEEYYLNERKDSATFNTLSPKQIQAI